MVKEVMLVLIVLMENKPYVGAGEFKVECFLLSFLKIRLLVGTRSYKAQLAILFIAP